jgi:UDP-N-acetylmuramoyl-L-alanyl-D-glutamate--2,6-diaminopimelate ligase
MQLQKLLKHISTLIRKQTGCTANSLKQNIECVTLNSKNAKHGDIFIASMGLTNISQNGHHFIEQAKSQNVSCILLDDENYFTESSLVPMVLLKNSRIAAAQLNEALYGYPSGSMDICGVTGTNGKTTVSFLTASIMQSVGKKSAVLGTLGAGNPQNLKYFGMTTPEAELLSPLLRDLRKEGYQHVTMEVSSHALSTHRVDGIIFRTAAFTNLSIDHLDFHVDLHQYRQAKQRLFEELLPAQNFAIVPENDPLAASLQKQKHPMLIWGYGENADIKAFDIQQTMQGLAFVLEINGQKSQVSSQLFGIYNLDNMLCAAGLSFACGISVENIAQGLTNASMPAGRTERIISNNFSQKPTVFVDFAHTPDALKKVLSAMRQFTKNRLIVVFGCGGDRDRSKRPQMGFISTSLADKTFITSDNPRSEDPEEIMKAILSGVSDDRKNTCQLIHDRQEAIKQAIISAHINDIIVIAGKGHEKTQEISDCFHPFDDAYVAKSVLENWPI